MPDGQHGICRGILYNALQTSGRGLPFGAAATAQQPLQFESVTSAERRIRPAASRFITASHILITVIRHAISAKNIHALARNVSTKPISFQLERIQLFASRDGLVVQGDTKERFDAPQCSQRVDLQPMLR
jgi:hypothetical protein